MNDFFNILGAIGSLCSIIGIPFTLWQIHKTKTSAEASKEAINNFLILDKNSILSKIIDILSEQTKLINDLNRDKYSDAGYKPDYNDEQCKNIIKNIGLCFCNLPPEYDDIIKKLQGIISDIDVFMDTGNINKIRDIRTSLYSMISLVKIEKENCIKI